MAKSRRWYTALYFQVLVAIAIGIFLGHFFPRTAVALKPLGDAFVSLIRMMIAPVIFCIVVQGIASTNDLKKVGSVGIKTLVYFEIVSTLALLIGILVSHLLHPGGGLNLDPATLDTKSVTNYLTRAKETGIVPFLLAIIPRTVAEAFVTGDVLQVLLISILTGFAVSRMGALGERVIRGFALVTKVVF